MIKVANGNSKLNKKNVVMSMPLTYIQDTQ